MVGRWLPFSHERLGGRPEPVSAPGRDGREVSSTLGAHVAVWGSRIGSNSPTADRTLGNSVGANGWPGRHPLETDRGRTDGSDGSPVPSRQRLCLSREVSGRPPARGCDAPVQDSYLVDSASSHMLVSKIKPCMSKYKQLYCETANGSLNQLSFI